MASTNDGLGAYGQVSQSMELGTSLTAPSAEEMAKPAAAVVSVVPPDGCLRGSAVRVIEMEQCPSWGDETRVIYLLGQPFWLLIQSHTRAAFVICRILILLNGTNPDDDNDDADVNYGLANETP